MTREVLLIPNPTSADNIEATRGAIDLLQSGGLQVRTLATRGLDLEVPEVPRISRAAKGCELVIVLGGDGTFLRAADLAYAQNIPVLGINGGHIGFLAEWEADSLNTALEKVIDLDYRVEERMTLEVRVFNEKNELIGRNWALNEVSIEKQNNRGVLDALLEVDFRPVSSFGCDGILISTPTGSTAYAFSAGGPVMWPELEAILVVPNNAHAIFAKPLVVSPKSTVAVESASTTSWANAVMDGFRRVPLAPGARVEVTRGARAVKWVRLDDRPFADRLVTKFRLPVSGWRGPH